MWIMNNTDTIPFIHTTSSHVRTRVEGLTVAPNSISLIASTLPKATFLRSHIEETCAFIYIIHSLLWYKNHFCTPVSLCICLLQSEKAYNLDELETSVFVSNLTSSELVFFSILQK